jgi:hypothetical protein
MNDENPLDYLIEEKDVIQDEENDLFKSPVKRIEDLRN